MFSKVKIGDRVYIANAKEIRELQVVKKGRIYFYAIKLNKHIRSKDFDFKFNITTGEKIDGHYYAGNYVYLSKQVILDERERADIFRSIKKRFEWIHDKKISLNKLREIQKILED